MCHGIDRWIAEYELDHEVFEDESITDLLDEEPELAGEELEEPIAPTADD